MQDMIGMFRFIYINFPLLDTNRQVSAYTKLLKDLCMQKRRSRKILNNMMLNKQVSQLILQKILLKLAGLGTPINPFVLGDIRIERDLLDLGVSVNILSGFFYDALHFGEQKPITMTIQLANWSVKIPRGILEDVPLNIENFIFPVDFIILDIEDIDVEY